MTDQEAIDFLRPALPDAAGGTWADLGAGTGTFTRALAALLGPGGRVHAVDADDRALAAIRAWAERAGAAVAVTTLRGDFTRPLALPSLDGVVTANALHFAPDAAAVLSLVASYLNPGGRLVLIEYDRRPASRWVPYPVSTERFHELAATAGFTAPQVVGRRPSRYGGELYIAVAERIG